MGSAMPARSGARSPGLGPPVAVQPWRRRLLRFRRNLSGYVFVVPALFFLGLVFFYPILKLVPMSLVRIAAGKTTWVGLSNFSYLLLRDEIVRAAVLNNLRLLLGIPVLVVLAVIISVSLYERVRGTSFYQAVILLPYLLSISVAGLVMAPILGLDGALNAILKAVGLGGLAQNWLGSSSLAIWSVLGVIIWRELGMGVAFLLAELLTLDEEMFDAAKVDGCNWLQQVRYISIPQLKNIISFYALYLVITLFSWTFGYVYVMTNGGPGFGTTVLELTIYRFAIEKRMPHMSAALSLLLFLGMLVFVWAQFRLRRGTLEER